MKKKYIILALIALVAIGIVFFVYKQKTAPTSSSQNPNLILYYGETCPHCKIVEAFLQENKIAEKVDFSQKEVFLNINNAKEMNKKATLCNINTSEVGVPFLWNAGQCIIGDEDIINFFKDKAAAPQGNDASLCEANKQNADTELKNIFEKSNYCNADSDCIDIESMFSCPFNCSAVLVNKNADIEAVREITKKYYSTCPECSIACSSAPPSQDNIVCRDKKCIENKTN